MTPSLATVVIPFPAARTAAVNATLQQLGDPGGPHDAAVAGLQASAAFVHFMSMLVVPAVDDETLAHLLVEVSADGHPEPALHGLAHAMHGPIDAVLQSAGHVARNPAALGELLVLRRHDVAPGVHQPAGVVFCGTPDMSLARIRKEAALATRLRARLDRQGRGSALGRLEQLRAEAFQHESTKWALVPEPIKRIAGPLEPSSFGLVWSIVRDFGWPWLLLAAIFPLYMIAKGGSWVGIAVSALCSLLFTTLLAAATVGYALYCLGRQEQDDVPWDREPEAARMQEIMAREDRDGVVQNHLFGISRMKQGWFREYTLRVGLWIVAELGAKRSRPGFIDQIGNIHFARWLTLPRTDRLVFLSNYDGNWQGYLEDFIARLRQGLTTVWSNTVDFPQTHLLRIGGAADGSRFKRWARRQQWPSYFWYSAYPDLTTDRIRINARIRHGFAAAATEEEAEQWLSLFGYTLPQTIESEQIPALAFGGLGKLPHCHGLVVEFPTAGAGKAWLRLVRDQVSYGERADEQPALVLGLTASGMRQLGLGPHAMSTFPLPFQQGMADPLRQRLLGDERGPGTPAEQVVDVWADQKTHALLLVYDWSPQGLQVAVDARRRELKGAGCQVTEEIPTEVLAKNALEPFGFRDGISQPVMRGSLRASRESHPHQVVNPGELVLGYRDNLGIVAPTPRCGSRDLGRNGTYLVVRQLLQDRWAFWRYLDEQAKALVAANDLRIPYADRALVREWLGAKLIGRWRDGTSLVLNPHNPGGHEPDNAYMFGREDADGLRCPFGAHVRRANPRDSLEPDSRIQMGITNRHRILRVGRAFTVQPDPANPDARLWKGAGRGLLFMCVNADIERQFEFVHQSWIMGRTFHNLDGERDPILAGVPTSMTIPTPNGPLELASVPPVVKVMGGGYFFMPSRTTLQFLAG